MRYFLSFLIVLFAVPALCAPTQADLKQLQSQIRQEQQASELNAKKAAELSGEVQNVQKQMIQIAKTVQEKESDLTRLETRQKQMLERQKELEERLSLTNRQIIQMTTGLQTLAIRPPELALMQVRTPLDTLRSRMLMGYSIPVIQGTNKQVRQDLSELSRLKADLQEQIVRIKSTQSQLSEQSSQMDRLLQQKSLLQAQYQVSQAQSQERVKVLGAQARDLKDLLDRLDREKKESTRQAVQYLNQNKPSFRQTQVPTGSGAFAKAKGRLPIPVKGTVIRQFGDTMVGGSHAKGITLSARAAAHVIAPFDGTVLFAGPFKNYGQLIILDHGDSYLTLLAGMETINPTVGQSVLAGEPIGQLKSSKPELYLEIRKDGQPIDPTTWFAR